MSGIKALTDTKSKAELAEMVEQLRLLVPFVKEAFELLFAGDPTSEELRELAAKHELLMTVPYVPGVHQGGTTAEEGDPWYVATQEMLDILHTMYSDEELDP